MTVILISYLQKDIDFTESAPVSASKSCSRSSTEYSGLFFIPYTSLPTESVTSLSQPQEIPYGSSVCSFFEPLWGFVEDFDGDVDFTDWSLNNVQPFNIRRTRSLTDLTRGEQCSSQSLRRTLSASNINTLSTRRRIRFRRQLKKLAVYRAEGYASYFNLYSRSQFNVNGIGERACSARLNGLIVPYSNLSTCTRTLRSTK
ncbi:hypothetical protein AB6A40_006956 [Gnathostoma spinigerum]|uniref:Uncharacterized protein n=1 Tax=Gnathostoma spinigerum TaxID=75299 RepID=A0ABD6EM19_9BILA